MKRPFLREVALNEALKGLFDGPPGAFITMSPGQWDGILASAYDRGFTLLVVDKTEKPVKAYRKPEAVQ